MTERRVSLLRRLFGRHTARYQPEPEAEEREDRLRGALLRCETLTESEVDEYMRWKDSAETVDVPLDYELTHPEEPVAVLYADNLALYKTREIHTAQISPETLAKVQQVLPLLYLSPGVGSDM